MNEMGASPGRDRTVAQPVRDLEERLRAVIESVVDAIITIDRRGVIESFNSAAVRIFGYAAGDVIGRNVSILMPEPDSSAHDGYIERHLRTGESRIIGIGRRVRGKRKDGTTFPMELATGRMMVGGEVMFTGICRDVTERVRMEAELLHAHKLLHAQKMEALGQLTSGIAHDFNNLLTVALGNIELMQMRLPPDTRLRALSESVRQAVIRGANLVERLRAFSRRGAVDPIQVDINSIVRGLVEALARTAGAHVNIETRLDDALWRTRVEPGQVEAALINLVVNARDAMPEGGKTIIRTANVDMTDGEPVGAQGMAAGRYVVLAVEDNGIGMSAEVKRRAFDPFFTTKGIGKGTGLGLSMVYGFAQSAGGGVRVDSAPHQGTTVALFLPAIDTHEPVIANSTLGGGSEGILLVEDNANVRETIREMLTSLGYRVATAENGPAALAMLERCADVALLITDIMMPGGMTGIDLVRKVRDRHPTIKTMLTTGYADEAVLHSWAEIEGTILLTKPYGPAVISEKVREALGR